MAKKLKLKRKSVTRKKKPRKAPENKMLKPDDMGFEDKNAKYDDPYYNPALDPND